MAMASRSRLSMDIIHDILVRLRVKTLCKFLCVSKSWYALISDPIFRSSHDRRAKENPLVIVAESIPCSRYRDIHISLLDSKGDLVQKSIINTEASSLHSWWFTCPDLVLLYDWNNVYVCNTITRDLIKIPTTRKYSGTQYRYVLAHAPSTKEYKLLAIGLKQPYENQVLTIGDDCWRTVMNPPIPISTIALVFGGVHTEEAIYMIPEADNDDLDIRGIVRFDLEREEWSVVPTPSGNSFFSPSTYILRGTGEQLWIAGKSLLGEREFDLWSLKDRDKGIWMKECKVRMPFLYLHSRHSFFPVAIDNNGRILIHMNEYGNHSNNKLLLYNSDGHKNFQVIMESDHSNFVTISFFVESFHYLTFLDFARRKSAESTL